MLACWPLHGFADWASPYSTSTPSAINHEILKSAWGKPMYFSYLRESEPKVQRAPQKDVTFGGGSIVNKHDRWIQWSESGIWVRVHVYARKIMHSVYRLQLWFLDKISSNKCVPAPQNPLCSRQRGWKTRSWTLSRPYYPAMFSSLSFTYPFSFPQSSTAVVVCSMVIAMASIRVIRFMDLLLLFHPVAATLEYGFIRPTPTSVGLVGIQPMAPHPTRPPSMNEINGELRKRRLPDNIYSAIPKSWCAFLEGDWGEPEIHWSPHILVTK